MLYELCITLRPQMYLLNFQEQAAFLYRLLHHVLFVDYRVSAVIEPTRELNAHVHALIEIPDAKSMNKFCNRFRGCKSLGRHPLSQVRNYPAYVEYMNKDIGRTSELLAGNESFVTDPVIIDFFGILGRHPGFFPID